MICSNWRRAVAQSLSEMKDKLAELMNTPLTKSYQERLEAVPTKLNEFGFDDFGFTPEWVKYTITFVAWLYKYYFRAEPYGLEKIPPGRVLLISNHSGQIPIDGLMIGASIFLEGDPPRIVRSMVERWASTLPYVSTFFTRVGQILGTPENARALLEREEALLVFPEGTRGINKVWKDRYKLVDFGPGFMRLALETKTPILPIAVVGAEEQLPSVSNLKPLAKLLGMPAVPVLPQLLVPVLGWLPLPTKYRIYFGDPMYFEGDANDEDEVIAARAGKVRRRIQQMLTYGLKQRKNVFW